MGLFGFGKKKNQPSTAPKQEPAPDFQQPSGNGTLKLVNGSWTYVTETDAPHPSARPVSSVWSETVDAFLARSPEAKLFKLTGRPDDLASYEVGNRCHVEEDDEADGKYNVTIDGIIIGRLPSSAVSFAEKIESLPEDLSVIIAEIEYDMDKDRDIISVYIA